MSLQVLGIEELGYRKRLWYGITELRVGHPEWCTTSGDTVSLVRACTCTYMHRHVHTCCALVMFE